MGEQHITVTTIGRLIAVALTASASGNPEISLPEAEAALVAARWQVRLEEWEEWE